jgi:protein O-GlcNAc transferase
MNPNRNAPCPCGSGKKYKHCCELKAATRSAAPRSAIPTAADFNPLLALFNTRRYAELETQVSALLAIYPDAPFAWQLLGGALQMQGKAALAAFQKVAELSPHDTGAHFNLGVAFKSAGQLEQAATSYRRALVLKSDYVEALSNLGNALQDLGQFDEAVKSYRWALVIQPMATDIHYSLGNALRKLKQPEQAAESYRQVVRLKPDLALAHCDLGSTLKELGNLNEAVECYQRAIEIAPMFVEAYRNLGGLFRELGRTEEAFRCYQRALQIQPDSAEILSNLALIFYDLKQFDNAIEACQHAIALNPSNALAHNNLGLSLKAIGKLDRAVTSYRSAIACDSDCASAYNNLGNALKELRRYDEAIANYRQAINRMPNFAEAYNNLGTAQSSLGQFSKAQASFKQALEVKPDYFDAHSNLLMAANYTAQSAEWYLAEALRFGESVAKKVVSRYAAWLCEISPPRLRVGIVSGDFRNHSVGYFLESLLTQINPSKIELIAYTNNPISDDLTARIQTYFSAWKPLFTLSDQAAAALIHADGVHILIDLSGHTAKNRLPIFAWKPAPVQCTWLGLPATTGIAEIDYVLGDPIATPSEDAQHFTEKIWQMPDIYLCLSTPNKALEVNTLPALTQGYITFASFNNLSKMNDAVVALWARILIAVPTSRLLLKAHQLKDSMMVTTTLQRFAAQGIGRERLILVPPTTERSDHLSIYYQVDIGLDPFPYPGVTTSAEALWMGIPILTMQGDRFMSRTATSIVNNAGLPDWVAANEDDYVEKATHFANDLPKLAALRSGLRGQVRTSPLFDAPRFARHFEDALWGMWKIHKN